jgi:hypothetical protein
MKGTTALVALGVGIGVLAAPGSSMAAGRVCVDRYDDGGCVVKPNYWGAGAHASVKRNWVEPLGP